ncbi:MARVEL domain-containing protein, partial [Aspergillus homomorphus CBS 101889]
KKTSIEEYWHLGGACGLAARATMRMLQFVFAVIVAALYGVDLAHATKTRAPASSEWIFAEVVAALSALTCIVHCFVVVKRVAWSAWDAVLFVLWLAQTGVFGTLYVPREVEPADRATTTSLIRMRMAVWFDLLNMGLWLVSTVMGVAWCVRARRVTRSTEKCDCRESCVETGSERDVEEGIVPDSK